MTDIFPYLPVRYSCLLANETNLVIKQMSGHFRGRYFTSRCLIKVICCVQNSLHPPTSKKVEFVLPFYSVSILITTCYTMYREKEQIIMRIQPSGKHIDQSHGQMLMTVGSSTVRHNGTNVSDNTVIPLNSRHYLAPLPIKVGNQFSRKMT